ncbi:MAG: hypothetical protein EXS36_10975 [Pedosphaera sp.]|nr:hypothetical protein [Pedosphaera sp.]
MKRLLLAFGLFWISAGFLAAQFHTDVQLQVEAKEVKAGDTFMVGVQLKMEPEWHVYWQNPGDSGSEIKLDWTLPEGVSAGGILWPVPEKFTEAGFATFVYFGNVTLLVPLTVSSGASSGDRDVRVRIRWQECKKECIQASTNLVSRIMVGVTRRDETDSKWLTAARAALPSKATPGLVRAYWEGAGTTEQRPVVVEVNDSRAADFFPYKAKGFAEAAKTETLPPRDGWVRFRKSAVPIDGGWPTQVAGLVIDQASTGVRIGREALAPIEMSDPSTGSSASGPTASAIPATMGALLFQLLSAFIGGLLLNIMPCVLPVLALKVLGFVNQAKQAPGRVRQMGLIYGLGVMVSFLVLAGVAISIQHAGHFANWNAPFQNPIFRVIITTLITLVALNLFGVFDVTLDRRTTDRAFVFTSKEGASGAFFNGVLAALLATPCTAPFLAPAVAFALSQPAWVILLFFAAIGAGLASPFVLLCWNPAWLKWIPRPGYWMVRFKHAMGFPMLATAVWLFWATATRMGESGVLWFGLFLVVLAAAVWVWGEFVQRSTRRQGWGMGVSVVLLAVGYFGLLEKQLDWRTPAAARKHSALDWGRWSKVALEEARKGGRPVLVDFTADTCLNCKVNKATSINIAGTIAKVKAINAVLLEGDFTDEDAAIAAELRRYGRNGVPLVLVYSSNPALEPRVLPLTLTPSIVQEALDWAAR